MAPMTRSEARKTCNTSQGKYLARCLLGHSTKCSAVTCPSAIEALGQVICLTRSQWRLAGCHYCFLFKNIIFFDLFVNIWYPKSLFSCRIWHIFWAKNGFLELALRQVPQTALRWVIARTEYTLRICVFHCHYTMKENLETLCTYHKM